MKTENDKLKFYFLGTLSPKDVTEIEQQIITDPNFATEMDVAETELIEDYLEKTLTEEELELFEKQYLITPERFERIGFIKSLRQFAKSKSSETLIMQKKPNLFESLKSLFSTPKLGFSLGAIALISTLGIASFFVWKNYQSESDVLIALNNAQKNERPLESRISDFNYSPKVEGTRGNSSAKNEELEFAELSARNLVRQNPSAENLHELGRVFLAQKKFDEAIEQLEKGIKKNSNLSKLRNDLGVAFLEKGSINKLEADKINKQNEDSKPYLELFAKANEEFAKAIELDKTSLESYFNQALTIESLNLPNQAKEAWENYLKLDATSKWADEARERLKKLELNKTVSKTKDEILKEFFEAKEAKDTEKAWQIVSRNREMSSGKLIPQQLAFLFVDSKIRGDAIEAKKSLDGLIYVGDLEVERGGDLFWRDLASFYKTSGESKLTQLSKAKLEYLEGLVNSNNDNKLALDKFSLSVKLYEQTGNFAEQLISTFWKGYCLIRLFRFDEGYLEFEKIDRIAQQKSYKWLALTVRNWLSGKAEVAKDISKSIFLSKVSLKQAGEISDLYNQQRVSSELATVYFQTGQFEKAFDFIQKALNYGNNSSSSLRQKWRDYNSASNFFYGSKSFQTSLAFEKEALSLTYHSLNEKTFEFTSLVKLGLIYATIGDYKKSIDFFSQSQKASESILDKETENLNLAFANLQLGHVKRISQNYTEAIEHFNQAINFYSEKKDLETYLYDARKGRLYCYLSLQDDNAYQNEFPKILELYKAYRSKILEEQNRSSFFENEQDIYDIAVNYEFNKLNVETAFNYAEESRSRSLLDLQNSEATVILDEKIPEIKLSSNLSEPLLLKEIQANMPDETQLLVYSVQTDKIIIWTVDKNLIGSAKSEIKFSDLQEKVSNYLNKIKNRDSQNELIELSKEFYQILISPIKEKLNRNKQTVIIPDKVLFRLPFVTLYSDKYLIEEFNLSYSPSANVFLNCSKKAKDFGVKDSEHLLSIGNPSFNKSEYEDLQSLPISKLEAQEIWKLYQGGELLTENEVTKEKVKKSLNSSDVVHFAGHYLIAENSPLLSSFILAGRNRDESDLANYEIMGEKLSQIRLIVLSACDTGGEKYYKGEGMIGATRTFLAANVPLVVASQWSVDSEATKELMVNFHKFRKNEKLSTAEALRKSQFLMLKNEKFEQPYYWAAFATIGGYTKF